MKQNKHRFKPFVLLGVIVISMILTSFLITQYLNMREIERQWYEINHNFESCTSALQQFEKDQQKGSFKFFSSGLGLDTNWKRKVEQKYPITVFHLGCDLLFPFECYNKEVKKHLKITLLR